MPLVDLILGCRADRGFFWYSGRLITVRTGWRAHNTVIRFYEHISHAGRRHVLLQNYDMLDSLIHGLTRAYTVLHGLDHTVLHGLTRSYTALHGLTRSYTVLTGCAL